MFRFGGRQFLAILLCLLIVNPSTIFGASAGASARGVVGSISTSGTVRIGEIVAPSDGTIFAGDRVATNNGGAVIQYRDGSRIMLASESLADFNPSTVQLEKGWMSFRTASANGVVYAASTLRLEPGSAKTAANVTLDHSKTSVAVTEGSVKVIDPSGVQLASLNAGESRLFEEAAASMPSPAAPSAPAAAPQGGGGGGSHHWVIAAGIAVVGLGVGIAALVRANDNDHETEFLASQVQAAQQQIAALQARVNALATASAQARAIQADLALQLQRLATLQAQLAAGQITPAQAATQLAAINAAIQADINALNAIVIPTSPLRTSADIS